MIEIHMLVFSVQNIIKICLSSTCVSSFLQFFLFCVLTKMFVFNFVEFLNFHIFQAELFSSNVSNWDIPLAMRSLLPGWKED